MILQSIKKSILLIGLLLIYIVAHTQLPEDMTLNVCAKTKLLASDTTRTVITIFWKNSPTSALVQNYRFKAKNNLFWSAAINITLTDTFFNDTIATGLEREYIIRKDTAAVAGNVLPKFGYILAGRKVSAFLQQGRILVLIDSVYLNALDSVLLRYKHDLASDGFIPQFQFVSRFNTVRNIKQHIRNAYFAVNPAPLVGVLLLGKIPIPYIGNYRDGVGFFFPPDGHTTLFSPPSHEGAWPSDLYYGDMSLETLWTDNVVTNNLGARTKNNNIIGDLKFDQTVMPSAIELAVGRIDLTDLPHFALNDTLLLVRYLTKNHNYRAGKSAYRKRLLQTDNLGLLTGEPFGGGSFQTINPLYGDSVNKLPWATLLTNQYQFAHGFGFGTYSSCSGVVNISDFASNTYRTVFTSLFGSYFGDFDTSAALLRSALASQGDILTAVWSGRPKWAFHQMGTGNPILLSVLASQNIWNGSYPVYSDAGYGYGLLHPSFHGDVSLKLNPYSSPSNFVVRQDSCNNRFKLSWNRSLDTAFEVYVLQRSRTIDSTFVDYFRVLSDTFFTDSFPLSGNNTYMLRAIRRENNCSGMYYNLSAAAFDSIRFYIPLVNAGADSQVCLNYPVQFGVNQVYPSRVILFWQPGRLLNDSALSRPTWQSTSTQSFILNVIDTNSRCLRRDTINLSLLPTAIDTIVFPIYIAGCGDTISIGSSTIGLGLGYTFSWAFQSAIPNSAAGIGQKGPHVLSYNAVGDYQIIMAQTDNISGCINRDTLLHSIACVLPFNSASVQISLPTCDKMLLSFFAKGNAANEFIAVLEDAFGNRKTVLIDKSNIQFTQNGFSRYDIVLTNVHYIFLKLYAKSINGNELLIEKSIDAPLCYRFSLNPNPSDDGYFSLKSNHYFINFVEIYNSEGSLIHSTNLLKQLLLSYHSQIALPAGLYLIKTNLGSKKLLVK